MNVIYIFIFIYIHISSSIHISSLVGGDSKLTERGHSYGKALNEFLHSDELPLLDPKSADKVYEYEQMKICMYIYVYIYVYMCIYSYGKALNEFT
jgi:hypothetical protein